MQTNNLNSENAIDYIIAFIGPALLLLSAVCICFGGQMFEPYPNDGEGLGGMVGGPIVVFGVICKLAYFGLVVWTLFKPFRCIVIFLICSAIFFTAGKVATRGLEANFNKTINTNRPGFAAAYYNRSVVEYGLKDYGAAWRYIKKAQELGYKVPADFLNKLKKASGREK